MAHHLVLGTGQIGSHLTGSLTARGDTVTVGSRRGASVPGARALRLDASDAADVTVAAAGADTIFVCTNPPYDKWTEQWPPIGTAIIEAARRTGAKVVLMGNLYGYGPPQGPMTAQTPMAATETKGRVRVQLWQRFLDAHNRGDLRAAEVRASDYFGPGAQETAHLGERFFAPLVASKTAYVVGNPALKHSWAYLPDIARTLAAVAGTETAFGRAWIVPSSSNASRLEIARMVNGQRGSHGKVRQIPPLALRALGLVNGQMREVAASSYQFMTEFIADATETEVRLGVSATDFGAALDTTLAALDVAHAKP